MLAYNAELSPYMRQIGEVPLLSREEASGLVEKIKAGDDAAREKFIRANLRLVVSVAREYTSINMLSLEDLISIGNIGLMKAVDKFDPAKGANFSTYGVLWIKQAIHKGLEKQGRNVRLPSGMTTKVLKIKRVKNELKTDLGRTPTEEEVSSKTGFSTVQIEKWEAAYQATSSSLDEPIGHDENSITIGETLPDEGAVDSLEASDKNNELEVLKSCVRRLKPRERQVLQLRFGLKNRKPCTLCEIAKIIGLTTEGIRQIEAKALEKLKTLKTQLEEGKIISMSRSRSWKARNPLAFKRIKILDYQRNRNRIREYARGYYRLNSERIKSQTKRYAKNNSQKVKERKAEYRKRRRFYLAMKGNEMTEELANWYVRAQLAKKNKMRSPKSFTSAEIDAHRVHLQIYRKREGIPNCHNCGSLARKDGFFRPSGNQRYSCRHCKKSFVFPLMPSRGA